jgi:hypothetical protein
MQLRLAKNIWGAFWSHLGRRFVTSLKTLGISVPAWVFGTTEGAFGTTQMTLGTTQMRFGTTQSLFGTTQNLPGTTENLIGAGARPFGTTRLCQPLVSSIVVSL